MRKRASLVPSSHQKNIGKIRKEPPTMVIALLPERGTYVHFNSLNLPGLSTNHWIFLNCLMCRLGILGARVREKCVDFIFHSDWPGEGGRKKQPQITDLHTAASKLADVGLDIKTSVLGAEAYNSEASHRMFQRPEGKSMWPTETAEPHPQP